MGQQGDVGDLVGGTGHSPQLPSWHPWQKGWQSRLQLEGERHRDTGAPKPQRLFGCPVWLCVGGITAN